MIRRYEFLEDQMVKRRQEDVIVIFEHHVLSRSIRAAVTVHRLPGDGNFLSDLWKGAGTALALLRILVRRPCRDAKSVLSGSGGYASLHHRLISGRPSGTQTHLLTCW